jgi:hypothetical protein
MGGLTERFDKGGEGKLALRFPSGSLKGSGAALSAAMSEEGFLVRPGAGGEAGAGSGAVESWRFDGLAQEGGEALLVGPPFDGASLDEARGLEEGMAALLAVARALSALAAAGKLPRGIRSPGILLSAAAAGAQTAGGAAAEAILVLPPSAVAKAVASQPPEALSAAVARLVSPHAKDAEADASFLLAQAAYRFATGRGAYEREAAEKGGMAAVRRCAASAALAAPRLDPALAALIDAALDEPGKVGLDAWIAALESARAAGWTRVLSPDAEAEIVRRRVQAEADASRRRRREEFLRKRGGLLAGAAIALVLLGFVVADIARAERSKPDYSALPPGEVVARYYAAIDGLDIESLEACGRKDAIKADRDMVTNLYVLVKTRMAYEGKSPLIPANRWVASGKEGLKEGDFLYGIVGLDIAEEGASPGAQESPGGAEAATFRVVYSLWTLERTDPPSGEPSEVRSEPCEDRRIDIVRLTRSKKGWRIEGIERRAAP